MHYPRTLVLGLTLFTTLIAACGGAALVGGDDPAGITRQALTDLQAKDLTKLTDIACAADKADIANSFTGGLGNALPGADPNQVLQAVNIDTSKVTVGTPVVNGDTATVPLSGSMHIQIDTEKIKPIVKAALASQGLPNDDATVTAALSVMGSAAGQDIPMDSQPLKLVKENGAWKVCRLTAVLAAGGRPRGDPAV